MKTNIAIELSDEERLNLGNKYYKKKKMITRYDLNELVKKYIYDVLEATPPTEQAAIRAVGDNPNSLTFVSLITSVKAAPSEV